jgi:hypothetical protein
MCDSRLRALRWLQPGSRGRTNGGGRGPHEWFVNPPPTTGPGNTTSPLPAVSGPPRISNGLRANQATRTASPIISSWAAHPAPRRPTAAAGMPRSCEAQHVISCLVMRASSSCVVGRGGGKGREGGKGEEEGGRSRAAHIAHGNPDTAMAPPPRAPGVRASCPASIGLHGRAAMWKVGRGGGARSVCHACARQGCPPRRVERAIVCASVVSACAL